MSKVALVTGVGRSQGIGYTIAHRLAQHGWNICINYLHSYDDRAELAYDQLDIKKLHKTCEELGVTFKAIEQDLENPETPAEIIKEATQLGSVQAVIASHTEGIDSDILTTSVESFDRHFAVNTRANWLLLKAFAEYAQTSLNT